MDSSSLVDVLSFVSLSPRLRTSNSSSCCSSRKVYSVFTNSSCFSNLFVSFSISFTAFSFMPSDDILHAWQSLVFWNRSIQICCSNISCFCYFDHKNARSGKLCYHICHFQEAYHSFQITYWKAQLWEQVIRHQRLHRLFQVDERKGWRCFARSQGLLAAFGIYPFHQHHLTLLILYITRVQYFQT